MLVTLLNPDDPRWVAMLESTPHDFYQLPGYVALTGRFDGGEPIAVLVEDGPRRLLMPLLLRELPPGPGGPPRRDATSPYGYPGIAVSSADPAAPADSTFTHDAAGAAIAALREAGVVSLFLRLNALLPIDHEVLGAFGRLVSHGNTVSIDLRKDEATMFATIRADHRRNIARLEKMGFTYEIDPNWKPESVRAFLEVYTETMDRLGASAAYYFDEEYVNDLHRALDGRVTIVLVSQGDDVAGVALFSEVDGIVQYHLGGTRGAFLKLSPIKGILTVTAFWAKSRGNRTLHLGGGLGGAEDALFDFKAGFSPDRHMFQTARIVVDQPAYDDLIARWEAQAGQLAADLDGYFPAYRAPVPVAAPGAHVPAGT